MDIVIEHDPDRSRLEALGVFGWPVWEKEISSFDWTYDVQEACYLLAGRVTVTPAGGAPVTIKTGDFVTFPAGLSCFWEITDPVKKHYNLY